MFARACYDGANAGVADVCNLPVVFCSCCGAYGQQRKQGLAIRCGTVQASGSFEL